MEPSSELKVLGDILPDVVSHLQVEAATGNSKNLRLVENKHGSLLLWSETSKYLYSTPSSTSNFKNASYQVLVTSISPMFEITTLKCSESFQYALLFGPNGIGVIELPRRWGNEGQFEGGKQICHCRFTILDESYFTHHISTKIIEAAWYPGSPNDNHIVALTSDNCIRFYDITMPEQPMMRLPLFDSSADGVRSVISFASVTGDLAVDFDIGLPSVDDMGVSTYPIYIIQESGDVWALYCKFSQSRLVVEMQGPLTMNPPADDNYGCSYCSLICLPTSPVTIAMATQVGTVHHCLVLPTQEDDFGDYTVNEVMQQEALFVYESIQLDMNWINSDEEDTSDDQQLNRHYHLKLSVGGDDGYITVSEGGIHSVILPWLQDINRFLLPSTGMNSSIPDPLTPEINAPAEISYLLCTQPSEESPAIQVCGCTLFKHLTGESSLMTLLSTGELIYLKKGSIFRNVESEFDKAEGAAGEKYTSPLRKLHGVGGFDDYIAKILAKCTTVPIIRSGGEDKTIPADLYYKLLTKTTQVLHEEYLQKIIQAKLEIQKRCKILKSKKEEQAKEIQLLQNNSHLMEKGDELAVKFETAQENMQSLYERIESVLRAMHSTAPILSHEEEEWGKELTSIQEKLVNLRRKSEIVKKKNENSILQSVPERSTSTKNIVLQPSQAVKFRAHLKDQEVSIKTLVEEVGNLNLKVGAS